MHEKNGKSYTIDGIFHSQDEERLYMEYTIYCVEGSKRDIDTLKKQIIVHLQRVVVTHTLDYLFPVGTGKDGLDLERHLLDVALILTGKKQEDPAGLFLSDTTKILDADVTKGYISRYAMPDRMSSYHGYDDAELYQRFSWEKRNVHLR